MFLSQREALFFFLSFFVFSPEANVTLTANFFLPEKYSTVKSSLFSRSATPNHFITDFKMSLNTSDASPSCCDPTWEVLQSFACSPEPTPLGRKELRQSFEPLSQFHNQVIKLKTSPHTSKRRFFTYSPGVDFSLQFSSTHTSFRSKLWKLFPWNKREKMLCWCKPLHFALAVLIHWTAEQDRQHSKFPLP